MDEDANALEGIAVGQMKAANAGDFAQLKTFYASDATFWSNVTETWADVDTQFRQVEAMRSRVANVQYVDVRVTPFAGGFLQQHRAIGDLPDGATLDVQACFICHVENGKIVRREEYLDSAKLVAVRG